jgi:hypothetical protein
MKSVKLLPLIFSQVGVSLLAMACGDFAISGRLEGGRVMWITVRCIHGGNLRLISPWDNRPAKLAGHRALLRPRRSIKMQTKPGQVLTFEPSTNKGVGN